MTRLHPPDLAELDQAGEDPGETHPSSRLAGTLYIVEPWEVELGDILDGLHHPIDSIQTDGVWWWYGSGGAGGTWVAKRLNSDLVNVWRDAAGVEGVGDTSAGPGAPSTSASSDGPPPFDDGGGKARLALAMPLAAALSVGTDVAEGGGQSLVGSAGSADCCPSVATNSTVARPLAVDSNGEGRPTAGPTVATPRPWTVPT